MNRMGINIQKQIRAYGNLKINVNGKNVQEPQKKAKVYQEW